MLRFWAILSGSGLTLLAAFFVFYHSEGRAFSLSHKAPQFEVEFKPLGFQKFVDELPILPSLKVPASASGTSEITLRLQQTKVQLHRDLPATLAWGYEGTSPGPTIEVESGQELKIHWKNELPPQHFLPAATGMDMSLNQPLPDVRNVTHLHGADVEQSSMTDSLNNNDGWPDAFNIPGQEQISTYPNRQSARNMLYHDHGVGTTGRNVAAGLIGLYQIHDDYERSLNLPSGSYDITLAFQARGLKGDGSLYYSDNLSQEYYGNVVAINGKLWPYLNVEPRKYRFRMVNVSNARSYDIKLLDLNDSSPGPAFYQIGSDGGFLENTAILNDPQNPNADRLRIAPAERADVIIDFSQYAGRSLILNNTSRDGLDGEIAIPQLMKIIVGTKPASHDASNLPMKMRAIPRIDPKEAVIARQIDLTQVDMGNGLQMLLLNNKAWHDPITERVQLGTTEIWKLTNTTKDLHPFHMHLVSFQVLDRTNFDSDQYLKTGKLEFTGSPQAPDENERGWKDVIKLPPGTMTRIIMKFNSNKGFYVYHCHILEHEDMDMMRPFEVYK